jgi:hypothetical protein
VLCCIGCLQDCGGKVWQRCCAGCCVGYCAGWCVGCCPDCGGDVWQKCCVQGIVRSAVPKSGRGGM